MFGLGVLRLRHQADRNMGSLRLLLLILGLLLVTSPAIRCQDEEDEGGYDEEGGEEEDVHRFDHIPEENDVKILTEETFHDYVMEQDIILVEFYAPWCGHCKALTPKYEAAAAILKENDPPIPLAKVDATVEKDLGTQFEITGYPTLKFFLSGDAYDYDGPREADGIVEFMRERADPEWTPPPEAVISVNTDEFDNLIQTEEYLLVEFYAPWCGHCKKLAPELEKAAVELKKHYPPIRIAKVDATVETELGQRYEVSGYPTMKIFRKGKPMEYTGGRKKHEIVEHMIKNSRDASGVQKSEKELRRFVSLLEEDIVVAGFFTGKDDPMFEIYTDTSNALREDFVFTHIFDADAVEEWGNVVVFIPKRYQSLHEDKWYKYIKREGDVEELTAFLIAHRTPLVGQYDYKGKEKTYKDKRPLVLVFFTVDFSFDHRGATQLWRGRIAEIAKNYRGVLTFAVADEEKMSDVFREFGFDDSSEELNIGIIDKNEKKYAMKPMEEFDADEVKEFLDKFIQGSLKPKIKSQVIPKKQGIVKTVVANSFDKMVRDPKKDVLIEFYAPWCGHCKKLEPIYKELAKKYKPTKNLVIAKFDATANDAPDDFPAEGFPTIYFAPADNKDNPIKFDGDRELEAFDAFLEGHATVPLKTVPVKDEL